MRCSMQDIFNQHFDSFAQQRTLHPRESRAAWCIRHCYTPALASHALVCPKGHYSEPLPHACRHRSCPRCADKPRQLWIASQFKRMLPCPHVHIVFTLPHVLLPLWSFNRTAMIALLFEAARDTLLDLMSDPKRLGVRPGLLMALHTWGRTLSHHPHVHCLLSAGGIDPSGQWKNGSAKFLLPLKPMQRLFCGKLLARLKLLLLTEDFALPPNQALSHWLDCTKQLYRAHWNIEIQPPYEHARGVALYLARYVKGGPLPKDRALSMDAKGMVRMGYTDHHDGRSKTLCLPAHEFIARVLWHAPPTGVHTVRYAGLYTRGHQVQYDQARRQLTPEPMPAEPQALAAHPLAATPSNEACTHKPTCPDCQAPLQRRPLPPQQRRQSQISISSQAHPPPTTAHLGPTRRSNGHSVACGTGPPAGTLYIFRTRASPARHAVPLN